MEILVITLKFISFVITAAIIALIVFAIIKSIDNEKKDKENIKKDKENVKKETKKKYLNIVVIIGIILVLSSIGSCYNAYKKDKNYELKGYQTADATCTEEYSYIKTITR